MNRHPKMFRYSITDSKEATKALEKISTVLFQTELLASSRIKGCHACQQTQKDEDQIIMTTNENVSSLQLVSMKESFDLELLTQFYEELMIPNFPLEGERDDIEDWIYCLDKQHNENQQGPSMDVILLLLKQERDITEKDKLVLSSTTTTTTSIVGGIAFEYYRNAQCGLLSYIVVADNFRRLGILKNLHPVACIAMQLLHEEEQQQKVIDGTLVMTAEAIVINNSSNTIKAIFAETNTIEAGDAPPAIIRKRHEILYNLGYRHLKFPYVQPPLAEDTESFDDIMLLIYSIGAKDNDNDNDINVSLCDERINDTFAIESEILYNYVVDFYQSVTGYCNTTYKNHWYYTLVDWYRKENYWTEIAKDLPWKDTTQEMKDYMIKMTTSNHHLLTNGKKISERFTGPTISTSRVTATATTRMTTTSHPSSTEVVVVGAGIAGLVATITLAEEYLQSHQEYQQQQHPSQDENRPYTGVTLTITLVEANMFVGGRIRTVLSDVDTQIKIDEDNTLSPLLFTNDHLSTTQKVDNFAPWPVAIGAEFIHGVDSKVNELIEEHEDWLVQETFDLCASSEEYPSSNSFIRRRNSLSLTTEQRNMPHVQVFIDERSHPLQHQYHDVKKNRIQQLIHLANNIWSNLQNINENTNTKVKSDRDMSLEQFIEEQICLETGNLSDEDVEKVKQILECLYSNTAGSSNRFMGVYESSREECNWEYTESNFRSGQCFVEFIKYYLDRIAQINEEAESINSNLKINIVTNCPVVEIRSTLNIKKEDNKIRNHPIRISASTGDTFSCDKCIVTVPLGVLKAKKINFRDEYKIPTETQDAIDTINMFSGIKVHMLLKIGVDIKCISELMKSTELFFCPGEIFSQVWLRRNEETVFLTGFCVANCRDRLIDLVLSSEKEGNESKSVIAQDLMIQQIQRIFEPSNSEEKIFIDTCSPSCSSFALHDWSEDEFTLGIYSSPSIGASFTHRECLTKPIKNDIWFAGEHVNTTTCATVQSAMESGAKAAKEVSDMIFSDSDNSVRT